MRTAATKPVLSLLFASLCLAAQVGERRVDFEDEEVGRPPRFFNTVVTGDKAEGKWVVEEAEDAPSGKRVLTQRDGKADDERYALPFRGAGLSLLLDLMVEREGPDVIGEMARVLATTHPGAFDLAALCTSVTDLSREELEAELFRFARTSGQ